MAKSMTERLYYTDSYLREFQANIVDRSEDGRSQPAARDVAVPVAPAPGQRGLHDRSRVAHRGVVLVARHREIVPDRARSRAELTACCSEAASYAP